MSYVHRSSDVSDHVDIARHVDASPATRLATSGQRTTALGITCALAIVTLCLLPFASLRLPAIQAFLPAYQTAVIGAYLITAFLMYGHFRVSHSVALLQLCAGSLYTSVVLILQFLSFPGAFLEHGPLLGGSQTTIWLWFFWHLGPAVGALLYAFGEYRQPGHKSINIEKSVQQTAMVLLLAIVVTVIFTETSSVWLPILDINGNYSRITSTGIAPALQIIIVFSILMLWRASKFRNVLHIWVGLALVALLCDNMLTMAGACRLSLGWYVGRLNALFSGSVIMTVYLLDMKKAYERTVSIAEQLATSNAQLEMRVDEARLDPLTGLAARALFIERAEYLLASCIASDKGFITLFIDLDGFKSINDRFGHDHGDMILRHVAEVIQSVLHENDIAGRLGGDEFVVCINAPLTQMSEVAFSVSERIVDKIEAIGNGISASVGISLCRKSVTLAMQQADEAMYDAKRLGKNRFNVFRDKPQLVRIV